MLGAFIGAGLADLSTQRANRSCMLAVARHGIGRKAARCRAVRVQGNTARHHFHVVFFQTSCKALLASLDARHVLVRGVVHQNLLISSSKDEREPAQLAARSVHLLPRGVIGAVGWHRQLTRLSSDLPSLWAIDYEEISGL